MRVFLKEKLNDDEDDDLHHGTYHQEDHDSINTTMLAEPILNDRPIKTQVFHKKYSSLKDMISLMKTRYVYIYMLLFLFMFSYIVIQNDGYGFDNAAPYSFKHWLLHSSAVFQIVEWSLLSWFSS